MEAKNSNIIQEMKSNMKLLKTRERKPGSHSSLELTTANLH